MINRRDAQATLITRADIQDVVRGIALTHTQTMRYVPKSPEGAAYSAA